MYSDFCTGEILSLSNGVQSVLLDTALMISSFGEDEAGEIYVVGLGGTVHRTINPNASPTDPPSAVVALSEEGCRTGQTLTYQRRPRWYGSHSIPPRVLDHHAEYLFQSISLYQVSSHIQIALYVL